MIVIVDFIQLKNVNQKFGSPVLLVRQSNGFVVDLVDQYRIVWWWKHEGKNQTWRKEFINRDRTNFYIQSMEIISIGKGNKNVYIHVYVGLNGYLKLVPVCDKTKASTFCLDNELNLSYIDNDSGLVLPLRIMHNNTINIRKRNDFFTRDLEYLNRYVSDPLNQQFKQLNLQLSEITLFLEISNFELITHNIFPVLIFRIIDSNDHFFNTQNLKQILIHIRDLFILIFNPIDRNDYNNENFQKQPGWSLTLNLQKVFTDVIYESLESNQMWFKYCELLTLNDTDFGFVYLESWVYYGYLSITVSVDSANMWLESYRLGGQSFIYI